MHREPRNVSLLLQPRRIHKEEKMAQAVFDFLEQVYGVGASRGKGRRGEASQIQTRRPQRGDGLLSHPRNPRPGCDSFQRDARRNWRPSAPSTGAPTSTEPIAGSPPGLCRFCRRSSRRCRHASSATNAAGILRRVERPANAARQSPPSATIYRPEVPPLLAPSADTSVVYESRLLSGPEIPSAFDCQRWPKGVVLAGGVLVSGGGGGGGLGAFSAGSSSVGAGA